MRGDECECEKCLPRSNVNPFQEDNLREYEVVDHSEKKVVTIPEEDEIISPRSDPFGNPEGTRYEIVEGKIVAAPESMRQFETGATRNLDVDPDIYGFTSPLALGLFAQYMHENRTQADGSIRDSDNWKKGIPMDSYIRSARRHLQDLTLHHDGYGSLAREDIVSAMAGLFFNVQGYMHEYVKREDV